MIQGSIYLTRSTMTTEIKQPLISVIVPVYNGILYLRECVDSILNQSFTDFELILVDDGSSDGSDSICDEYAERDNRIVVIHQENKGVSFSRNLGVTLARADWILFIDCDDWIDEDYISAFADQLVYTNECTLLLQSYNEVYSNSDKNHQVINYKYHVSETIPLESIVENAMLREFGAPYCKLFNKEIINKFSIHFDETLSYGEDTLFYLDYIKRIKCFYVIDCCYYSYRSFQSNTLSSKPHDYENLITYYYSHLLSILEIQAVLNIENSRLQIVFNDYYIRGILKTIIDQIRLGYKSIAICQMIDADRYKYIFILDSMIKLSTKEAFIRCSLINACKISVYLLKFLYNVKRFVL